MACSHASADRLSKAAAYDNTCVSRVTLVTETFWILYFQFRFLNFQFRIPPPLLLPKNKHINIHHQSPSEGFSLKCSWGLHLRCTLHTTHITNFTLHTPHCTLHTTLRTLHTAFVRKSNLYVQAEAHTYLYPAEMHEGGTWDKHCFQKATNRWPFPSQNLSLRNNWAWNAHRRSTISYILCFDTNWKQTSTDVCVCSLWVENHQTTISSKTFGFGGFA